MTNFLLGSTILLANDPAPGFGGGIDSAPSAVTEMGSVIMSIIMIVVLIVIGFHLVKMMGSKQYAQAFVMMGIGGFVTWFLVNPDSFMTFFSNIFSAMF